ncbi:MAG: PKD domain-containing protein [Chitinophagaceae bacterium]|nr:MAG: PKD domain-containing protein [Chitinophagaceae bacterium]
MKTGILLLGLILSGQLLSAQYTLNGSATQDACNAYTLTPDAYTRSGSVWNNNKINLSVSFDFNFDINLGNHDSDGADGLVFVLQPISTSVGTTGGGLGYEGIFPAVGVTVDTWQNNENNDPVYDHIAIQLNGDIGHSSTNNIAGPVTAISGNDNIEDGNWHSLHIIWDVPTKTLTVLVDGVLRVSAVKDFVTDIFSGNPMVYWGFTGSTGGAKNWQRFRTALNPSFHFGPAQKRCVNEPISFFDSTISFTSLAKFYWNFGDGSPVDSINLNPVHTYTVAGDYTVIQRVIGADGCEATNTQTVRIGSKPIARFGYTGNMCIPMPPYPPVSFHDSSTTAVGTINNWFWDFDNGSTSTFQNPITSYSTIGHKNIKFAVKSLEGCESDTLYKTVPINFQPVLDFSFTDSLCLGTANNFSGIVVSSSDPIEFFRWQFDTDPIFINTQNATYTFTTPGTHNVFFMATSGGEGCLGMKIKTVFVVNKPTAFFVPVSSCINAPTQLRDSSYTSDGTPVNTWWWDLGNGQFSTQQNPVTTYTTAGPVIIRHAVANSRGCLSDTISQTINVQAKPVAKFGYLSQLCSVDPVQFNDSSFVSGGTISNWYWLYNGAVFSNLQNPLLAFTVGTHQVGLIAESLSGCLSDTVFKTFSINTKPLISMSFANACKNTPVSFSAAEITSTGMVNWNWSFGDGASGTGISTQHVYIQNGSFPVSLQATSAAGCSSNLLIKNIIIYGTNAYAGQDTIAAAGQPVQLHATGGLSYLWSPGGYLNDAGIANPIAILSATQSFRLKAFTPEGCESYDTVIVKIYKGPDIYLPNAFTPNDDGLNDLLRGIPVGLQQFNWLRIFNRYGQEIFSTTDYHKGWDGKWKGQKQDNGVYVVIASGIDFRGNPINKKATVMLIR